MEGENYFSFLNFNLKILSIFYSSLNGGFQSRFSTSGIRSLPITPSGCDRQTIPISCPDGLAHALSEQNIRLQQIVYEHSVSEISINFLLN